jgi:ubiquinone/menaquinone biosynthesis C-methylase UbiE
MSKVKDYEKRRYRGLDQKIIHFQEQSIIKDFIRNRAQQGDTVLDLPIGYGRFVPHLLEEGFHIKGVDANANMLQSVQENFGHQIELREGKADAIPFQDNSFDGFVSVRLFQHIHDDEERRRIFTETKRVTSKWGVITLYTPSLFHKAFRQIRNGKRLTMLTLKSATQELRQAGWNILSWKCIFPGMHCQTILLLEALDN